MASRAAEVKAVDRDREVEESLGAPDLFGPSKSGCTGPWQKSPDGAPNIVFMWQGANVMWRITMSLKFGASRVISSITRLAITV